LNISYDPVVNAFAQGGNQITIYIALSELIDDSPSELAFAIAHEMGHIYQQQTGTQAWDSNREYDADAWGVLFSLRAGYDPYAISGTLAKLAMVTGDSGLVSQFEDQLGPDAHKSFNTRIELAFNSITLACNSSIALQQACANYKSIFHPHLPNPAPLLQRPDRERIQHNRAAPTRVIELTQ
jgi:predicted Zn-dependent protease